MTFKKFIITTSLMFVSLTTVVIMWSEVNNILEIKPLGRESMPNISSPPYLQMKEHKKQKHLYFLRTHKCGSTTIYSIFLRFGYLNNLTFVLPARPESVTISRYPFQKGKGYFLPPPKGENYEILCHHTNYNRTGLEEILPKDTMYIGLVREPLPRFVSAFIYYTYVAKKRYLTDIEGGNITSAISSYLKNPAYYEPKQTALGTLEWSHTNNGMANDFGFPLEDMKNVSKKKIDKFISKLDGEFDLVIVLEYLDESLVLMKRILDWSMKDILYLGRNNVAVLNSTHVINSLTEEDRIRHQRWELIDFALYNHFSDKLWRKILHEDDSFHSEVEDFRTARYNVVQFCNNHVADEELIYTMENSREELRINSFDCSMLETIGNGFTKLIKQRKEYPDVPIASGL